MGKFQKGVKQDNRKRREDDKRGGRKPGAGRYSGYAYLINGYHNGKLTLITKTSRRENIPVLTASLPDLELYAWRIYKDDLATAEQVWPTNEQRTFAGVPSEMPDPYLVMPSVRNHS